jgi:hypothetical protein
MKSSFYHIQINIDFKNFAFYKELFSFLGWSVIFEMDALAGFKSKKNGDIWFIDAQKKELSDFDKMGMNHLSLRVEKQEDIDEVVNFLKEKKISALFDTPRHRPEFNSEKGQTYYQVMFKTVDNILFEVVYIGLKTQ